MLPRAPHRWSKRRRLARFPPAGKPKPKLIKVFWFFFSKKNRLLVCRSTSKESKRFFFEKKKQKTFMT
jgi:hypothetical protein